MKTAAIAASELSLPSWSRSSGRLADFVSLMKPRVMLLAVFTALVGLMIAPGHLDPLLGFVATLAIAAGAGAAGMLNMWYDADIDAVMARTARRPIPRGGSAPAPTTCWRWRSACSSCSWSSSGRSGS
jgi:heme o synthase